MRRAAALVCCTLLVSGCAAAPGSEPVPEVSREVRLSTVSSFGGTDASAGDYQELIRSFCEKNPDIKVSDASTASDENWKAKVTGDFASGNEPDVLFFFTGADARPMIDKGKVVSIDTIRVQYPDYGKNILPEAMEYMLEADGRSYALPVRGVWEGLFCNRDLFEDFALPLPRDWESLLEAVQGFANTDIAPVSVSFSDIPHYWLEHLILSAGGVQDHKFMPQAGMGIDQYPKSWITALETLGSLGAMGAFPEESWSTTNYSAQENFFNKRAAMMLGGSWLCGDIADTQNTVVLPFPPMPDSAMRPGEIISGFSMGFYITGKAWDNPMRRDAAVAFVSYMTSDEAIAAFAGTAGRPAADIPSPAALSPFESSSTQLWKNAPDSNMPVDSRLSRQAWEKLYSSAGAMARGEADVREVLNEVAQRNRA